MPDQNIYESYYTDCIVTKNNWFMSHLFVFVLFISSYSIQIDSSDVLFIIIFYYFFIYFFAARL